MAPLSQLETEEVFRKFTSAFCSKTTPTLISYFSRRLSLFPDVFGQRALEKHIEVLTFHFSCLYGLCSHSQQLKLRRRCHVFTNSPFESRHIGPYLEPYIVLTKNQGGRGGTKCRRPWRSSLLAQTFVIYPRESCPRRLRKPFHSLESCLWLSRSFNFRSQGPGRAQDGADSQNQSGVNLFILVPYSGYGSNNILAWGKHTSQPRTFVWGDPNAGPVPAVALPEMDRHFPLCEGWSAERWSRGQQVG